MICEQTAKAFFSLNLNVLSCKTRKRFKLILSFLLFHSRYKETSHKISSVIHKDKLKHVDLLSRCTYFFLSLSGISLLDSISFWVSLFARASGILSSLTHTHVSLSLAAARCYAVTSSLAANERERSKERILHGTKRETVFFSLYGTLAAFA